MKKVLTIIVITLSIQFCKGPGELGGQLFNDNRAVFKNFIDEVWQKYGYNKAPSSVEEVYVFDFDHTIANTETLIPVTTTDGTTDRRDSKCFVITKGEKADFSVFTEKNLKKTDIIGLSEKLLKKLDKDTSWVIVVTARSQEHTFTSALKYLKDKGLPVDGVLAVNSKLLRENLWGKLQMPELTEQIPRGFKKALLISALLEHAKAQGASVKTVKYYEDTDKHITGYINVLPNTFPEIRSEVFDLVRSGKPNKRKYQSRFLGYGLNKVFYSQAGFELKDLKTYSSRDCAVNR